MPGTARAKELATKRLPLEGRIRRRAYELYVQRGNESGSEARRLAPSRRRDPPGRRRNPQSLTRRPRRLVGSALRMTAVARNRTIRGTLAIRSANLLPGAAGQLQPGCAHFSNFFSGTPSAFFGAEEHTPRHPQNQSRLNPAHRNLEDSKAGIPHHPAKTIRTP